MDPRTLARRATVPRLTLWSFAHLGRRQSVDAPKRTARTVSPRVSSPRMTLKGHA